MKNQAFDVVVVGAGPAGLAAAASAAQSGARVGLLDDNPTIGGQIWRGGADHALTSQAQHWFAQVNSDAITVLNGVRVVSPLGPDTLLVEISTRAMQVHFKQLILATGARERFLPFPGWTLPGVMGAGGLQALVKGGLPILGKRVVVVGSGPLLLAVAAYLKSRGALVQCIVEQTSWAKLRAFSLRLPLHPKQLRQAGGLGWSLRAVPIRVGCWIKQAHGTEQLEAVTIQRGSGDENIACDYLACGYGLCPNTELPTVLGCEILDGAVRVDEWQLTSREHIYCAGETTGVGGLDLALLQGQIAGFAATGQRDAARARMPERARARRFARLMVRSFSLRPELKQLPAADTLVCRCEDVSYRELQGHSNWRSAKLHTRCGMGPCQGRVCGTATAFLFGWTQDSVRPPIVVARVASFIQVDEQQNFHQSEEVAL